jgi:hypothetical protein
MGAKNKKYAIEWKGDEVVAMYVDGVRYDSLDQIENDHDREKIMALMVGSPDLDFDKTAASGLSLSKFMFPLFLSIAVLMLVVSVLTGINTGRTQAREVSTPGQVIDMTIRMDSEGNEYYYPVVGIVLPDGASKSIQTNEGSWPPAYEIGETVTVLYDVARPTSARIQSTGSTIAMWTWTIVGGILAIAFFLASLLIRWVLKA